MSDLAECFVEEAAVAVKAKVPLLPEDGIPTTMEIVVAAKVIHDAYIKNCAAAHAEEQRKTIERVHRQPLARLRQSLDF